MDANEKLEELKWLSAARSLTGEEVWWLIERVEALEKDRETINSEYSSFYD